MVDMQLLNDALLALAVAVGAAILLAVAIVGAEAFHLRHARSGIRQIEQHLATAAKHRHSAPTR